MVPQPVRFYLLLSGALLAGYVWLALAMRLPPGDAHPLGGCLFKMVFRLPCPSCGITRTLVGVLHGYGISALLINPLGIVVGIVLLVFPLWILADGLLRRPSLWRAWLRMEGFISQPRFALPLAVIVAANWIWNINKGL